METIIRSLKDTDRQAIVGIINETNEFLPFEKTVAIELLDACLSQGIASGYHVLIAEVDSRVAGYICYGPTPMTESTWDLYWMAVDPSLKRQGIGGQLMSEAENSIKNAGGRLILVETSSKPSYENTRRFHQKQGYRLVARVPDFYAPGDDRLILQKIQTP